MLSKKTEQQKGRENEEIGVIEKWPLICGKKNLQVPKWRPMCERWGVVCK